jgi:DnaJ-class molecular chaperone
MRDPYEVLGVPKGTDTKTIKKAYRTLARTHHPDLHPGDSKAEDRFKEMAAAYDFLSNADKKARYDSGQIDASGAPRMNRKFYRQHAGGGRGGNSQDPGDNLKDMEGMDIFADLFRGMRRTGGWRKAAPVRGQDIRHELSINFLDAIKGATRAIVLPEGKQLKVTIPAGSEDGQVLRLKAQGTPGTAGGAAGDVHVELRVKPHPRFTRAGNDIHSELPVAIQEAMLGGKAGVPTIDGTVTLTIPKGSNSGTRLRLRGKGAPAPGGARGDHYVTLKVVLPDTADPELLRLIEEWARKHPYRVRDTD